MIVITAGILGAYALNNWNTNRISSANEKSLLNSIHIEFIENRMQLDSVVYYHHRLARNCDKVISMFPILIGTSNLDSLAFYLNGTFSNWTFNPSQGSINALINSGSIGIIKDEELRGLLISWADLVRDYQEEENNSSEFFRTNYGNFMTEHFDFNFNFRDDRNNLAMLQSLKFENLVKIRKGVIRMTFSKSSELPKLQKALDEIIELSKPKK